MPASVTTLQDKTALIGFLDTSHWRSILGLTLNLKQSAMTGDGGFLRLDEVMAKRAFGHYMRGLNRQIYKAAFRHHGKRLKVIPILEKSQEGRWHYHVAMEPPQFMEPSEFGNIAMNAWLQTPLGYAHGAVTTNVDAGWIAYMAKLRGKSGFEIYTDCIDTEAFYNPTDC